jgi:hypothetical protein
MSRSRERHKQDPDNRGGDAVEVGVEVGGVAEVGADKEVVKGARQDHRAEVSRRRLTHRKREVGGVVGEGGSAEELMLCRERDHQYLEDAAAEAAADAAEDRLFIFFAS